MAVGIINTVAGFSVVVLLMLLQFDPITANISGYAVGLVMSFALNRQFVFLANGRISSELVRFLSAFSISFAANLVFLHYLIDVMTINPFAAQLLAAAVYTAIMFALCDVLVFKARRKA